MKLLKLENAKKLVIEFVNKIMTHFIIFKPKMYALKSYPVIISTLFYFQSQFLNVCEKKKDWDWENPEILLNA